MLHLATPPRRTALTLNALIALAELFVLPALAAVLAGFALEKSDESTIKKYGRYTVIVIAAFATALLGQYFRQLATKPSSVVAAQDLGVTIQRRAPQLKLSYDVLVTGDSDAGFTLVDMTGLIEATDSFQSEVYPFAADDFQCTKEDRPLILPVKIGTGSSVHLTCGVSLVMSPTQLAGLVSPGDHKLELRFVSDNNTELVSRYCFNLTPGSIDDFTTSGAITKRFIDAKC